MTNNPFAKKLGLPSIPIQPEVKKAVHDALAENHAADSILPSRPEPDSLTHAETTSEQRISDSAKLSRLVDDDFPFDESQIAAMDGMASHTHACLTGAAGTGKTTTTKGLVDRLLNQDLVGSVDMETYFARGYDPEGDSEDDYEAPQRWVPSVCMVGFTGRSAQMIKKNFPRDWHGNIMTIHRMLAFAPEYYDDFDDDGNPKRKMRFIPTYTADFQLPWDIILIDEAGMLGLELWHQVLAACKPGCRIYMIGDINQLPPVHGRSVFGFAMANWPSWELTHIHRQQGKNNPIVDNAWRVLKGQTPISEGNFQMVPLKGDAVYSSRMVRAMVPKLKEKGIYEPNRDTIITPINGEDGSRGFALGQLPLNREFSLIFNPRESAVRYMIDGGREKKQFAVGDKVMATRNDHTQGITNGMTGIIVGIQPHEGYGGDARRFGPIDEVNAYIAATDDEDDSLDDFSLEELSEKMEAMEAAAKDKKEKAERGPSSHIVTVRFGDDEHGFEIPFATLAEVGSLMTAYVVTCHKMQGGEAPTVVIILHDSHKAMLFREWLYTAITRASQRCILLYTTDALRAALNKQKVKGTTLAEKVECFNRLQDSSGLLGPAVKVKLPESRVIPGMEVDTSRALVKAAPAPQAAPQVPDSPAAPPQVTNIFIKNLTIKVSAPPPSPAPTESEPIDITPTTPMLDRPASTVSQWGAYRTWLRLTEPTPLMLPKPVVKKVNPFASLVKRG